MINKAMVSSSLAKPSGLTMVPSEGRFTIKFGFIVSQEESHIFELKIKI